MACRHCKTERGLVNDQRFGFQLQLITEHCINGLNVAETAVDSEVTWVRWPRRKLGRDNDEDDE